MSELVVEGLKVMAGGELILRGVDLHVHRGEVHVVMGPNGSGKSTLAHVLMGRSGYEVVDGRVRLDGADLLEMTPFERAQAGLFLAMQYPTEVPGVSLVDMLAAALAASPRRRSALADRSSAEASPSAEAPADVSADRSAEAPPEESAEAPADVSADRSAEAPPEESAEVSADRSAEAPPDKSPSGNRRPSVAGLAERIAVEADLLGVPQQLLERSVNVDFSGGEQKRGEALQLAVLRPVIAILDEIDSGLDIDALHDVSLRIERAATEDGMGVLAITHYSRLLNELRADRVHILMRGRIVSSGGPDLADELERSGYERWEQPEEVAVSLGRLGRRGG